MQKHKMILKTLNISDRWTLFLDRDGVINQRLVDNYVQRPEDFHFTDGSPEAIRIFARHFAKVFVVTNQQGIGKGLMTEAELAEIHKLMLSNIEKAGGRIDKVYHCPGLQKDRPLCRKPRIGMALVARRDFPEIRFTKSIMAGDTKSDMIFGKRLKMKTVLINPKNDLACKYPELVDFWFPSLIHFAREI
jgi:histidinol-phosphate phosphatase family protein